MEDLERRIRERAYRIWLDEGRPDGREAEHWAKARDLVTRETERRDSDDPPGTTRDRADPMPSAATERPREPPQPADMARDRQVDPPAADVGAKPAAPKRRRRR